MDMARRYWLTALLALAAIVSALPARAQSDDERYNIMRPEKGAKPARPEPWLAPKYKSPRGTPEQVVIPRPQPAPKPRATVPPPLYVPQTGQMLPNLPAVAPSGPGGRETTQDRAARCAHQAGVYGQAAGDRNAYVGSCINQ
jgi:hypothetical protein